jgi:hypothetical protein
VTRPRRAISTLVVLSAALVSSACIEPQTLGTLKGVVNARSLLDDPGVISLAGTSARYLPAWVGSATVIALLALFLRLKNGDNSTLAPTIAATLLAYTIAVPTQRDALFWPRHAVAVADNLANLYPVTDWLSYGRTAPPGSPGDFAKLLWTGVSVLRDRVERLGGDRSQQDYLAAEAIAQFSATPVGALLITLASAGAYVSSIALQLIQATLVALLAILLPVVVPFLVLPWTRSVFWGYLRWFIALLLWAPLFRIVDSLMLALHLQVLTAPLREALAADSTWTLAQVIPNSIAAGFVIHLAFFALQFMVPGLAHAIVHGVAQRSLR